MRIRIICCIPEQAGMFAVHAALCLADNLAIGRILKMEKR